MMTTAVTVPRLDIPPQEDVMELSPDSDQHPGKDGDTDIEIDFAEDQTQDQDNDYIIEDARSEGGVGAQEFPVETGNDDVMLDEEGSQGDLHDDTLPEDEDLDDAGDYIQYDANQKPSTLYEDASYHSGSMLKRTDETELPATEEVHSDHHDDVEAAIAEGSNHQNIKIEQLEAPSSHEVREDAEPLKEASPNPDTDLAAGSNLEDLRDPLDWSGTSTRKSEFDPVAPNKEHNDEAQAGAVTSKLGGPRSDPISTQNDFTDGTTSVHPVVVVYQDSEISLFPPSNQSDSSTFFLHDENLASSNISDLLLACKSVLADSISEEDELELSIEELGLCISEASLS
ncbi:hypothetical protein MMC16_000995 [Acarospora aff. strigata]|nr:hypothetical protein [Acarospora aff. strigata]